MDVRKYRFTRDSYNAPVMPFCSLRKVLLLIKAPPVILTLLEYWNIRWIQRRVTSIEGFCGSDCDVTMLFSCRSCPSYGCMRSLWDVRTIY